MARWHQAVYVAIGCALPPASDGWQRVDEREGVTVERHATPTGAPWIRGRARFAFPPQALRDLVLDVPAYPRFMPNVSRATSLPSDGGARVSQIRYAFFWPLSDRDAVLAMESRSLPDGAFEVASHAVAGPPPDPGVIRLSLVEQDWRFTPSAGGTDVVYQYVGELGGSLPDFARQRAWREEPVLVLRALQAEAQRRSPADGGRP
jgi:hypothetical protein